MTTTAYRRPSTLEQALELLEHPGTVVLAGGTRLNARPTTGTVEVVDLQALDLGRIEVSGPDELRIGAMATLQQLVERDDAPDVLREAARREQPSTLRAQATVGGCVVTGHAESELVAALLVHEAVVHLAGRTSTEDVPLEQLLAAGLAPGHVVTGLTVQIDGVAAADRTARTPADRAIVAAYGRVSARGRRVALTGVAPTPVLVQPGDELDPTGDFRGASDYRRALADVLMGRVVEAIA